MQPSRPSNWSLFRRRVQIRPVFVTRTRSAIFLAFAPAAARELAALVLSSLSRDTTLEVKMYVYVIRYLQPFLAVHPRRLFAAVIVFHGQMEADPVVPEHA
jgi:hypothetical protein